MKTFVCWLVALTTVGSGAYLYTHPEEKDQVVERLNGLWEDRSSFLQDVTIQQVASALSIMFGMIWMVYLFSGPSQAIVTSHVPTVVVEEAPKKKEHGSFVIKMANVRILKDQLVKDKHYIEVKQRTLADEIPRTEDEVNKWIKALAEREKALRIGQEQYAKVLAQLTAQKDEYAKNKDQLEDINEELERIKSIT